MTTGSASGMMGVDPVRPSSPFPTPALSSAPTQEVDAAEIQVQVCLYAFDLIYLNGEVSSGFPSGDRRGVSLGASDLSFISHSSTSLSWEATWAAVLQGPRTQVGPQENPPGVCEALPFQLHTCERQIFSMWCGCLRAEADKRIQTVLS